MHGGGAAMLKGPGDNTVMPSISLHLEEVTSAIIIHGMHYVITFMIILAVVLAAVLI